MKLIDIYDDSFQQVDNLILLYTSLNSNSERSIRSDLRDRLFKEKIVSWPKKEDLWKVSGNNLLILGNKSKSKLDHNFFRNGSLDILLKSALVMGMSCIDKILHEAIMKNFSRLLNEQQLDKLISLPLSSSYQIALDVKAGTIKNNKIRPGHIFKEEIVDILFKETYLSTSKLEKVTAICGLNKVYTKFKDKKSLPITAEKIKKRWSNIYKKRNLIAHESDIIRKERMRKVTYNAFNRKKYLDDIEFIKEFGSFLAQSLDK